jgi:hypothetical protein
MLTMPCASIEPRGVRVAENGSFLDLSAAEVVAAVKREGRRLMILAAHAGQAAEFRREHGLAMGQVVYATPESVRGYSNFEMVVLPGFQDVRNAARTWEALQVGLLVSRRRPLTA